MGVFLSKTLTSVLRGERFRERNKKRTNRFILL